MHSRIFELSTDPNYDIMGQDFFYESLQGYGIDYVIKEGNGSDANETINWFQSHLEIDVNRMDNSFVADTDNINKLLIKFKSQINDNYRDITKYVKRINKKYKDPIKGFLGAEKLYTPSLKDHYDLMFYENSYYGLARTLDGLINICINFKNQKLFIIATYDYHY